jgi:hypothetical protein
MESAFTAKETHVLDTLQRLADAELPHPNGASLGALPMMWRRGRF